MNGFIIDPEKQSFEEIKLPNGEKSRLKKITELLGSTNYHITFIYPQEFTTCTGYLMIHRPGDPFFRVKGFVDKVKFGRTVVVDITATGFPKSDGITLADLKPLVTFFP